MTIGFFDSGIGGVSVLHEARQWLPRSDFLYYADTDHVPYGPKPKAAVREYVFAAVDCLVQQGAGAIVIACNTATSVAIEDLRAKYRQLPIIGMEPAVKVAVDRTPRHAGRILVTATALTLKEEKLHNLLVQIDNEHIVDTLPLPGLVEFAENRQFEAATVLPYLREQLGKFALNDYEAIVLGCTHFVFFADLFRNIAAPHTAIIDGNRGTVNNLVRILAAQGMTDQGDGTVTFYQSGRKVEERAALARYGDLLARLDAIRT
ncbi:MAG: glutamate racemase [Veillonellaceae bacterium]|nr:glutamate racemase [Veillonellaceae bacterium]